ncbi:hypothetical protein H0H92_015594 [Tricholoma furcatifolium]|nr:hypothetical protein H0H92_015594 [Tricholoma furcatifolium]
MTSNKRKHDNKPQFIFPDDPTERPPIPIELTRHLEISASQHGLSARRTTLEVPVDPLTLSTPSPNVSHTWNTTDNVEACWNPSEGSDLFSFERIDPSYKEDLINTSLVPSKRLRTTAMEWKGGCFVRTALVRIGLVMPLGHSVGDPCQNVAPVEIVVLHTNGIHNVCFAFCDCGRVMPWNIQLLQSHLFPATTIYPQTAATFELLNHFQLLSFMSKVSAFEYYQTLVRMTDNTGCITPPISERAFSLWEVLLIETPQDRYSAFLRMVREWRHIRMLKRAGRGHAVSGVKGTAPGECAVVCPACPYPGINLPSDYEHAPPEKAWLYSLFVGIDANFRLKRLKVSTEANDPGLNNGYAFCVETKQFNKHLRNYGEVIKDNISTCNNHDAIKSASIRGGKGIDASGVGKTECARHDMKRPVSVSDLQKGERIAHSSPRRIVVSYDIACQWARHLPSRASVYADKTLNKRQLVYLVPKFHLQAHRQECQVQFSFNFLRHVGRTDGEAPERGWAAINAVANSTKEMGPGSRRDTLDDHFGDYNWRKIMTFEQTLTFEQFTAGLPDRYTEQWRQLVEAWERDGNSYNPFAPKVENISENAVRLELALEDEA